MNSPREPRRVGRLIQQLPRIRSFFGTSETAVKSRIWIAVYVVVAVIRPSGRLDVGLHTMSHIRSLTMSGRTPINPTLNQTPNRNDPPGHDNR